MFKNCPLLRLIAFEISSRLQINRCVFSGSDLMTVVIPASVQALGEQCFQSCRVLAWVSIEVYRKDGIRQYFVANRCSSQDSHLSGKIVFCLHPCTRIAWF
jgi:hypothetical protein